MYHIFLDVTLFLIVQWVINSFIKMIVFDWYVIHCTWGRKSNYVNHPLLHWCTKRPNRYNWISSKTLCNSFLGYYDMKDRNIIELRKITFFRYNIQIITHVGNLVNMTHSSFTLHLLQGWGWVIFRSEKQYTYVYV